MDRALPSWLAFDAATGTFSGTPPLNQPGTLGLTVTASDGSLDSVRHVHADRRAGERCSGRVCADRRSDGGRGHGVVLPGSGGTFADADSSLTYTATLR